MHAESLQSCLTLGNSMDLSQPDSSVHGILQARTLERVAIFFSRESSRPRDQSQVSHTAGRFFTLWATRRSPFNPSLSPKLWHPLIFLLSAVNVMHFPFLFRDAPGEHLFRMLLLSHAQTHGQTSPRAEINKGPLDTTLASWVAEVPADNQHQRPDTCLQMVPAPRCWVNLPFLECHIPGLLLFPAFSDLFLSVSHMLWRCLYILLWFNLSLSLSFF